MERIGIYEAKARLSELIEQVERGGDVTITRHGKPVAKLVRAKSEEKSERAAVIDEILAAGKALGTRKKLTQRELRAAIQWGRK
jgi:prevent-host-death family protein